MNKAQLKVKKMVTSSTRNGVKIKEICTKIVNYIQFISWVFSKGVSELMQQYDSPC